MISTKWFLIVLGVCILIGTGAGWHPKRFKLKAKCKVTYAVEEKELVKHCMVTVTDSEKYSQVVKYAALATKKQKLAICVAHKKGICDNDGNNFMVHHAQNAVLGVINEMHALPDNEKQQLKNNLKNCETLTDRDEYVDCVQKEVTTIC